MPAANLPTPPEKLPPGVFFEPKAGYIIRFREGPFYRRIVCKSVAEALRQKEAHGV